MFDPYVADVLGDFEFSIPRAIAGLNMADQDKDGPSIRFDGLEITFFRRPRIFDIFTAVRVTAPDPWLTPVRVDAPVSSEFNKAPTWTTGRISRPQEHRPGPRTVEGFWQKSRQAWTAERAENISRGPEEDVRGREEALGRTQGSKEVRG